MELLPIPRASPKLYTNSCTIRRSEKAHPGILSFFTLGSSGSGCKPMDIDQIYYFLINDYVATGVHNSYAMVLSGIPWNMPRVTHEPLGERVYGENTSDK